MYLDFLLEDRAAFLASKYPGVPLKAVQELLAIDPSKGKYLEWLVRGYASKDYRWPEDSGRLQAALAVYHKLKLKPSLLKHYGADPDISKYRLRTLEDLADVVNGVKANETDLGFDVLEGCKLAYRDSRFAVVRVDNAESATQYAKGTKWCTSDRDTAQEYLPLFVVYEHGKKVAQADNDSQLMDLRDNEIEASENQKLCNALYEAGATGNLTILLAAAESNPGAMEEIKNNGPAAIEYISMYGGYKRWPEAEPAIAADPMSAYLYAMNVLRGRFPAGEKAIASDPQVAYKYATTMVGRFPAGEQQIATDPRYAVLYARDIIRDRWPVAEPAIMSAAHAICEYAREVIGSRWPEGELALLSQLKHGGAYISCIEYARDMIGGRWPAAETYIMQSAHDAVQYAKEIIKGRWPEAEPQIATSQAANQQYLRWLDKSVRT